MSIVPQQLKQGDIPRYTTELKKKQGYRCPICNKTLAHGRVALDHNHNTGRIRAVLCNQCNRTEGKVRSAMMFKALATHKVKTDPLGWLTTMVRYIDYHNKHPSMFIHPSWDIAKGKQKPVKRRKRVVKRKP